LDSVGHKGKTMIFDSNGKSLSSVDGAETVISLGYGGESNQPAD
jgi:hypothetical protein